MRAVFSILVRAGALRQALGDALPEDALVLSAINDVNLPKFTENDTPLFAGITGDLFPTTTLPPPAHVRLLTAVRAAAADLGLQPHPSFLAYVQQMYETVQVRHGLMLVGESGAGKSAVLHTLARALGALAAEEAATAAATGPSADGFARVHVRTLNPKSVTAAQLYGSFDVNTREFADGILAILYRSAAADEGSDRHWLVLDGPVDAIWVENLNTVLGERRCGGEGGEGVTGEEGDGTFWSWARVVL